MSCSPHFFTKSNVKLQSWILKTLDFWLLQLGSQNAKEWVTFFSRLKAGVGVLEGGAQGIGIIVTEFLSCSFAIRPWFLKEHSFFLNIYFVFQLCHLRYKNSSNDGVIMRKWLSFPHDRSFPHDQSVICQVFFDLQSFLMMVVLLLLLCENVYLLPPAFFKSISLF